MCPSDKDRQPLIQLVCFVAIIPYERLFDYGGEQMAFYIGKELGDLLVVSLNKWAKSVGIYFELTNIFSTQCC